VLNCINTIIPQTRLIFLLLSKKSIYLNKKPTIIYFCRDLRILDSPAFQKAAEYDAPIIPVFIYDPVLEGMLGAAPKWRLHQAIKKFSEQLDKQYGTRLILRRGDALGALKDLIEETGANTVIWSRQYDKQSIARNTQIKANLSDRGITVSSVNSSLLFEPWTHTGTRSMARF